MLHKGPNVILFQKKDQNIQNWVGQRGKAKQNTILASIWHAGSYTPLHGSLKPPGTSHAYQHEFASKHIAWHVSSVPEFKFVANHTSMQLRKFWVEQ
jgi:hypothetical protein